MNEQVKEKTKVGTVVSDKMEKTVTVLVERTYPHPRYGKMIRRGRKYYAHSEKELKVGSRVRIRETRPLSKLKRWMVVDVLEAVQSK